jgi:hypothetical protein
MEENWRLLNKETALRSVYGHLCASERRLKSSYPSLPCWGFLSTEQASRSSPFGPIGSGSFNARGISWVTLVTHIMRCYFTTTLTDLRSEYTGGSVRFIVMDGFVYAITKASNAQAYRELSEVTNYLPLIPVTVDVPARDALLFAAISYHFSLLHHCYHRLAINSTTPGCDALPVDSIAPSTTEETVVSTRKEIVFSTDELVYML